MMRSRILYITLSLILSLLLSPANAQVQSEDIEKRFKAAKELYYNDVFVTAEREFSAILSKLYEIEYENRNVAKRCSRSEVASYIIFCALYLDRPNIDGLVDEYIKNYPYSPELAKVKFMYMKYYYDKEIYTRSLDIAETINISTLQRDDKIEFQFMKSYCNLRVANYNESIRGFETVISYPRNKFTPSAMYYLGYLHYINHNFTKAIEVFGKLTKDHQYANMAGYYILESKFMLKDFDYVIKNGEAVLEKADEEYKSKVTRVISEAYFEKNMTQEAKRYFEMYSSSSKLTRKDQYFSGIISYTLGAYYPAIDAFSKVADRTDSLGHSAYYQLGHCYINIKNKHQALNAFKAASELNFDKRIQEDAMFNYAKLAFDINSDISAFNSYLKMFPSSDKSDDIYNYIAVSFLLKKDYNQAVEALNKVKKLTPAMTLNLQKASYFRAMQLIDRGAYRSAMPLLLKSIQHGVYNQDLMNLAKFWLAEVYYRNGDYEQSLSMNHALIKLPKFRESNEYPMTVYNIGYSYFMTVDFNEAINWFSRYLDISPARRSNTREARTRVADCYFMLRDYDRSAELFEQIASTSYNADDIYPAYYAALSYGLIAQPDKKISILKSIVDKQPNSSLYPQSMFELGRTYVQVDRYDDAKYCFLDLINKVKDSTYYAKSLIELGMINANLNQYDKALEYYDIVLRRMPFSQEAQSALAGIENIYQMRGKTDEFFTYLEKIGMSDSKSMDEKEMMIFNSAEQLFLAGNYVTALNSLNSYIEQYPEGSKISQVYYYKGDALRKTERLEEAADAFQKVIEIGEGSFVELSTLNYARIAYRFQRWDKAADAYRSLSEIAVLDNNKYEAIVGLMRSYFRHMDYNAAINAAEKVLQTEKGRNEMTHEVNYVKAKSLLSLGEREKALPILRILSKETDTPEGAEANYLLISDTYDSGDFINVENMVYNFSDSGTSQLYWLAKSFIVLGDSFAERDEWEQAIATFESIKDGYEPVGEDDDVLAQVESRLKMVADKR